MARIITLKIAGTETKADAGASVAVVPLTIPLLTGPATISTMVIYAEKTRTFWEHAVLVGYGVVIGLAAAGGGLPRAGGELPAAAFPAAAGG